MNDDGAHLRTVIVGVVAAAVQDAGASGVALLDDASPEATLLREWLVTLAGGVRLWCVTHSAGSSGDAPEPGATLAGTIAALPPDVMRAETHRYRARLVAATEGAVLAHPINKTALLLGDAPPEPLLPLADVYASDIVRLTGEWTSSDSVRSLAASAGGIDALDAALAAVIGERRPGDEPEPPASVPESVMADIRGRLTAGRLWRRYPRIVPKIGGRTAGIDYFG